MHREASPKASPKAAAPANPYAAAAPPQRGRCGGGAAAAEAARPPHDEPDELGMPMLAVASAEPLRRRRRRSSGLGSRRRRRRRRRRHGRRRPSRRRSRRRRCRCATSKACGGSTDDEALAIVAAYALLGKPMPADAVQVRSTAAAPPPPPARAPLPRRRRSSNRLFTPVPPLNPRSMGVRAQRREHLRPPGRRPPAAGAGPRARRARRPAAAAAAPAARRDAAPVLLMVGELGARRCRRRPRRSVSHPTARRGRRRCRGRQTSFEMHRVRQGRSRLVVRVGAASPSCAPASTCAARPACATICRPACRRGARLNTRRRPPACRPACRPGCRRPSRCRRAAPPPASPPPPPPRRRCRRRAPSSRSPISRSTPPSSREITEEPPRRTQRRRRRRRRRQQQQQQQQQSQPSSPRRFVVNEGQRPPESPNRFNFSKRRDSTDLAADLAAADRAAADAAAVDAVVFPGGARGHGGHDLVRLTSAHAVEHNLQRVRSIRGDAPEVRPGERDRYGLVRSASMPEHVQYQHGGYRRPEQYAGMGAAQEKSEARRMAEEQAVLQRRREAMEAQMRWQRDQMRDDDARVVLPGERRPRSPPAAPTCGRRCPRGAINAMLWSVEGAAQLEAQATAQSPRKGLFGRLRRSRSHGSGDASWPATPASPYGGAAWPRAPPVTRQGSADPGYGAPIKRKPSFLRRAFSGLRRSASASSGLGSSRRRPSDPVASPPPREQMAVTSPPTLENMRAHDAAELGV